MPPPAMIPQLELVFGFAVKAAIGLGGIVLFVLLVMGGIKFLTSGGDPKAAEVAQKTITYAIAGLILLLSSFLILLFIKTITGVDVTKFSITQP